MNYTDILTTIFINGNITDFYEIDYSWSKVY